MKKTWLCSLLLVLLCSCESTNLTDNPLAGNTYTCYNYSDEPWTMKFTTHRYERYCKSHIDKYGKPLDLGKYKVKDNHFSCYHDNGKGTVSFEGTIYDDYIVIDGQEEYKYYKK